MKTVFGIVGGCITVAFGFLLLAGHVDASSAAGTPTVVPTGAGPCGADHCIAVADDGAISLPEHGVKVGESVAFTLANRWQSVIDIERRHPAACEDERLELPYESAPLTGPMPRFAGGVIVRGEANGHFRFPDSVWQSDAVSGVLLAIPWRAIETAPGVYDFSVFTDALREATRTGKLVSIGIQTGSRSPEWIYDFSKRDAVPGSAMVTKATGGEKCFDQVHPHFWHPNYVRLITELQTALSTTLRAHGGQYRHVDKIKISGVNLMTSETRLPVERSRFCGFKDKTCSSGDGTPALCVGGVCPVGSGCGCYTDPADGRQKCGRLTDDLPKLWADAGYRRSKMFSYFDDLFREQRALFPHKDLNLMQVARAFPNVDDNGRVKGNADPDDVRQLIGRLAEAHPDHLVVLNAALGGNKAPQEINLRAHDLGVKQIGFQTVGTARSWRQIDAALINARDVRTPRGAQAVSFVEISLESFESALATGNADALARHDGVFRSRSGTPEPGGQVHRIDSLPAGTYHYKIGGTGTTGDRCHMGTLTVTP